jgi:hypothetical protein
MTNRLAGENSPYLFQHAGNPVDWFPWGLEALEKARREDINRFFLVLAILPAIGVTSWLMNHSKTLKLLQSSMKIS